MADIILEIAENGRFISINHGFIVISQQAKELARITIDTVLAVLLSADGITLTKAFLARMAEENIPIIITGKNYMPISMATPYQSHYKMLAVVKNQIDVPLVLKKQLWQNIIQNKIENQYIVLKACVPQATITLEKLNKLAHTVRSADSDNKEAQAARMYFTALFGKNFTRNTEEEGINAFLNYGYAIVRATFARQICACGLLPLLGLNHHNIYNPFCLVDDLMEVCRPLVDKKVFEIFQINKKQELNPETKKKLLELFHVPIFIEDEESSLVPGSLKYIQALVRCYTAQVMCLPKIIIKF